MKIQQFKIFLLFFLLVLVTFPVVAKKKKTDNNTRSEGSGASSFSLSPPVFDLECQGGEKKTLTVKLTNPNKNSVDIALIPNGMILNGSAEPVIQPIASLPQNNLARHLIIESPNITVPGLSYKETSFTIDIPEGLSGTQYVGFTAANSSSGFVPEGVVNKREDEYKTNVGVGMLPALAVTIKCNMMGALKPSYSLQKINVIAPQGNEPVKVKATLKNTGNSEIKFMPLIVLMDANLKPIARLKGTSVSTIIPGAIQNVEMAPTFTRIPPGTYKAVLTLSSAKTQLQPSETTVTIR